MKMTICDCCEHLSECRDKGRITQTGYPGYEHYIINLCRHCPLDYKGTFEKASIWEEFIYQASQYGPPPEGSAEDVLETIRNYDRILASDDNGTEYDMLVEMIRNLYPTENPIVSIFKAVSNYGYDQC